MKKTDITIILDRSGSMSSTKSDAIGGFNTFVEEQKKVEGEACLTLVQFDNLYQVDYQEVDIQSVQPLNTTTYVPRGNTALIDAMGRTIQTTKERIKKIKKADRPNVVVVIITDGEENASHEWMMSQVEELITKLRGKGWEFVFIGANQDAIKTGASMGIGAANSLSYVSNAIGTQAVFSSVSKNITSYRSGAKADMSFDSDDITMQQKASVQ